MTEDDRDAVPTSTSTCAVPIGSPCDGASGDSGVMVMVGAEKAFYDLLFFLNMYLF